MYQRLDLGVDVNVTGRIRRSPNLRQAVFILEVQLLERRHRLAQHSVADSQSLVWQKKAETKEGVPDAYVLFGRRLGLLQPGCLCGFVQARRRSLRGRSRLGHAWSLGWRAPQPPGGTRTTTVRIVGSTAEHALATARRISR